MKCAHISNNEFSTGTLLIREIIDEVRDVWKSLFALKDNRLQQGEIVTMKMVISDGVDRIFLKSSLSYYETSLAIALSNYFKDHTLICYAKHILLKDPLRAKLMRKSKLCQYQMQICLQPKNLKHYFLKFQHQLRHF